MKKSIITITIILIGFSVMSQCPTTNEDCEEGKGIQTNPGNPINCEVGLDEDGDPLFPWRLNDFDWKYQNPLNTTIAEYFEFQQQNSPYPFMVRSPWTGPTDAEYYHYVSRYGYSDYLPEDGWELIKMDFGDPPSTNTPFYPKLPYMIFYNKYTGILRFFGALNDPGNFKTVLVKLRLVSDQENNVFKELKGTNLLSLQGEALQPLDQKTDKNSFDLFVEFDKDHFMFFEMPLAYDPCICELASQLEISFNFFDNSNVTIEGILNGSIDNTHNTSSKPSKSNFARVLGAVAATAVAVKTGGTVINIKAYTELLNIVIENPNTDQGTRESLEAFKSLIDNCVGPAYDILSNLKYFENKTYTDADGNVQTITPDKYLKAIKGQKILESSTKLQAGMLDFCQKNKTTSNSSQSLISGDIKAWGTVTDKVDIPNTEILLGVPGSKWPEELGKRHGQFGQGPFLSQTKPAYPMYNERLGTFAVLETPEILIHTQEEICAKRTNENITTSEGFSNNGFIQNLVANLLLQQPTGISVQNIEIFKRFSFTFKLNSDFLYAFNPLLHLDEDKTKISTRIVISEAFNGTLFPFENAFKFTWDPCFSANPNAIVQNFLYDNSAHYKFKSPFVPIESIKNMPFKFTWEVRDFLKGAGSVYPTHSLLLADAEGIFTDFYNSSIDYSKIFIQFKITSVSNDIDSKGDNIMTHHIFTVPLNAIHQTSPFVSWPGGNLIQDHKIFDVDEILTSNSMYEGPVIINSKLSSLNGQKIKIYSLQGFTLNAGAEISPDIELIIGTPYGNVPQPSQTFEQVKSFCAFNNSGKYLAHEFSPAALAEGKRISEERERVRILSKMEEDRSFKFGLKPNPTSGTSTVFWDGDEMPNQLTLIDGTGQLLFETPLSGDGRSYDLDMSEYSHGVYFIIITAPSGKKGQQKLIKL